MTSGSIFTSPPAWHGAATAATRNTTAQRSITVFIARLPENEVRLHGSRVRRSRQGISGAARHQRKPRGKHWPGICTLSDGEPKVRPVSPPLARGKRAEPGRVLKG